MNPVRRRRLLMILLLLVAAGAATALVAAALQRNVTYLYTPVEVLRGDSGEQARFRLGGMVERGSFQRPNGSLESRFRVTDGDARLAGLPEPERDAEPEASRRDQVGGIGERRIEDPQPEDARAEHERARHAHPGDPLLDVSSAGREAALPSARDGASRA